MERTPEWYFSGFQFLQNVNPDRYSLHSESFLEGCYVHYKLIDDETDEQIGPEVIYNAIQGSYESGKLCQT